MGSEKVKVMLSPCSARPAVPPTLLAAWTFVPVGFVLSTTRFATTVLPWLPALSVASTRRS